MKSTFLPACLAGGGILFYPAYSLSGEKTAAPCRRKASDHVRFLLSINRGRLSKACRSHSGNRSSLKHDVTS
ncbi:hypothetical protein [Paenibacillus kribbensis]|uniref:hypothetical protein n=1 Tax=Paenibacillus kribbensis TaxID=172713 RepID=UPI001C40093F|nr:hypothetical protein [Paenibacillus kribbensis]